MRVLVLRPGAAAARTARRLTGRGHQPIVAPVLAIAATGAPPPPGRFDALLLTSANAAEPAAAPPGLRALPVFAVGESTAAAARQAGFATVSAADGDAPALAKLVGTRFDPPARLLLAAGRDRKVEPEASLVRAGYRVATWTVYAAEPGSALPPAARAALAGGEPTAALHFSRRSAATFLGLARREGLGPEAAALHHLCLSADVAAALDGCPTVTVAANPTEEALLALLLGR